MEARAYLVLVRDVEDALLKVFSDSAEALPLAPLALCLEEPSVLLCGLRPVEDVPRLGFLLRLDLPRHDHLGLELLDLHLVVLNVPLELADLVLVSRLLALVIQLLLLHKKLGLQGLALDHGTETARAKEGGESEDSLGKGDARVVHARHPYLDPVYFLPQVAHLGLRNGGLSPGSLELVLHLCRVSEGAGEGEE